MVLVVNHPYPTTLNVYEVGVSLLSSPELADVECQQVHSQTVDQMPFPQ